MRSFFNSTIFNIKHMCWISEHHSHRGCMSVCVCVQRMIHANSWPHIKNREIARVHIVVGLFSVHIFLGHGALTHDFIASGSHCWNGSESSREMERRVPIETESWITELWVFVRWRELTRTWQTSWRNCTERDSNMDGACWELQVIFTFEESSSWVMYKIWRITIRIDRLLWCNYVFMALWKCSLTVLSYIVSLTSIISFMIMFFSMYSRFNLSMYRHTCYV